ncbi:SAM-dependent methyltransferase [bacterium D16-51]|nr:SAM-dependent methyltransferase [bacterium D16-59]RKI62072.1 SAM-dependent methyltransferase [bacterium D16-51]
MNKLPERFCENMKGLLGEEYPEYIQSLSEKPCTALRINTRKISVTQWLEKGLFMAEAVSWAANGFYYNSKEQTPSKHPYYYAGLYYIQEPSAMVPASILPVSAGDKVLDLCAAPGGKATELGAKLNGQGLLVANDISVSRTRALVKNLQLAGICNAVVTAETPERLAAVFPGYFDKILVDAPCSGEGMFRREPGMAKDWLEKGPEYYAPLQKQILGEAYKMLKPGGKLVYSTCTFSVKEDEEVVQWFITEYPDMQIWPVKRQEGFSDGMPGLLEDGSSDLKNCIRIFPHRTRGEGHFAVLLQKEGQNFLPTKSREGLGLNVKELKKRQVSLPEALLGFIEKAGAFGGRIEEKGDALSMRPGMLPDTGNLRVVYQGLPVCELGQKIKMSHPLALAMKSGDFEQTLDLPADGGEIIRYLKGETLLTECPYRGNILVCVDGFGVGWAQGNGSGMLKNKYHAGWRYQ